MICPNCSHEEAYHGQSGCTDRDADDMGCTCTLTAAQVEAAEAKPLTKYYCWACDKTIEAASNLEGVKHIGCEGEGYFTRKLYWSRDIQIDRDGSVKVFRWAHLEFFLRTYKPTPASQKRVQHLFNYFPSEEVFVYFDNSGLSVKLSGCTEEK